MTANRKRIGDAFELRTQRSLDRDGWAVFPLSPSFAGVDLIAVRDGVVMLVECKSGRQGPTARGKALRKLHDAARYVRTRSDGLTVLPWLAEGV